MTPYPNITTEALYIRRGIVRALALDKIATSDIVVYNTAN